MFVCRKQGKLQKRGKINLIGRLQLTSEKTREEDNEGIVQLRILRTQVRREGGGRVRLGRVCRESERRWKFLQAGNHPNTSMERRKERARESMGVKARESERRRWQGFSNNRNFMVKFFILLNY